MTGAATQDAVSLAHNDRDATLIEIGTGRSSFSKQELLELERNEELVDRVVVTHRRNGFTSMDKSLVMKGGNVERSRTCDVVVASPVRPAAPQRRQSPAVAAMAAARQAGDG